MMKRLLYVKTNGYDMLVSVDQENNVRYLTETEEFPYKDDAEIILDFLNSVEDVSSWEVAGEVVNLDWWLNTDGHLGDASEIIAEIEKEL